MNQAIKTLKPTIQMDNLPPSLNPLNGKGENVFSSKQESIISLDNIQFFALQPRFFIDPDELQKLAESIKHLGVIEPLIVRPLSDGRFEAITGERRLRAAQLAGLTEVPIQVRDLSDEQAFEVAFTDNYQRQNLNPIEETVGILKLLSFKLEEAEEDVKALLYRMKNEECSRVRKNVFPNSQKQTVHEIFESLGLMSWLSFVTSRLPLLSLPGEILNALRQGKIAYTKAQLIARVKDEQVREDLLAEVIGQDLSLNDIKKRIADLRSASAPEILTLQERIKQTYKRLRNTKIWEDPQKSAEVEKLITQIERLLV